MSSIDSQPSTSAAAEENDDMNSEEPILPDFATEEKQKARAFLRERFLRVVTGIIGKPAKFHLYENTTVCAEFRGCDIDFLELYVKNLTTPLGTIPEAILRTNDVIFFEVDKV
ncbi:hypothetical protein QAD02_001208 [Eretmocerus hayati]|uniref:Uncharacterized protein n=1 Tax=Eretmocerus hayati TaxID=131215 RepID=A0ACC2NHZ9_9HYME|nr:hypothetical protein QAD02_001208 [Eretmocerus hayati]